MEQRGFIVCIPVRFISTLNRQNDRSLLYMLDTHTENNVWLILRVSSFFMQHQPIPDILLFKQCVVADAAHLVVIQSWGWPSPTCDIYTWHTRIQVSSPAGAIFPMDGPWHQSFIDFSYPPDRASAVGASEVWIPNDIREFIISSSRISSWEPFRIALSAGWCCRIFTSMRLTIFACYSASANSGGWILSSDPQQSAQSSFREPRIWSTEVSISRCWFRATRDASVYGRLLKGLCRCSIRNITPDGGDGESATIYIGNTSSRITSTRICGTYTLSSSLDPPTSKSAKTGKFQCVSQKRFIKLEKCSRSELF
jgi:hypothetical protein